MRKIKMYLIAIVTIIFITLIFVLFASGANDEKIRFLNDCGWRVEERCVETSDIIIPKPFDLVYENYNQMQLNSGFDLRPYMGRKGKRYTYIVTNYPMNPGEEVRANVICVDDKPIGGDICTLSINGFMHGLKEKVQ